MPIGKGIGAREVMLRHLIDTSRYCSSCFDFWNDLVEGYMAMLRMLVA